MKKIFIFKGLTHFGYMYKIELNEKGKVNTYKEYGGILCIKK